MPGVNLPASQLSYYLLTLLVCGILHEMGHAIAAVRLDIFSLRALPVKIIWELYNTPVILRPKSISTEPKKFSSEKTPLERKEKIIISI